MKLCPVEDAFIRYAVIKELRRQYARYRPAIDAAWPAICEAPPETADTEGRHSPSLTQLADLETWKGELEGGLDFSTGTAKKQELHFAGKLQQEVEHWRNTLIVQALNGKEEDSRYAEEYRIGAQSDYKLDMRDYLFGHLRYVNDRFSGYKLRLTETTGYGRRWIDDGEYLFDTRFGPGFRQSRLTDGTDENSWLVEFAAEAGWNFSEYFQLGENLRLEYAPDASILSSETFVKSRITDTLAFKTSLGVEHITDVPAGKEKTDTHTNIGIVYGF